MPLSPNAKDWLGLCSALTLVVALSVFGFLGWGKVSGDDSITHVAIAKVISVEKITGDSDDPVSYKVTYDLHGHPLSNYFSQEWYESHKTRKHFLITYRMANGYHVDNVR